MRKDGMATAQKILDVAQGMFLDYGYAGTSIDEVVKRAGITKGTFFYHYNNKEELAQAAVEEFVTADKKLCEEEMARAEKLSKDPLQQILIFVGLFIEMMDQLSEPYPGCLYASYCYQSGLLNDKALGRVKDGILFWRETLGQKIQEAIDTHKPKRDINAEALADNLTVTFEGAYILSRMLNEPKLTARQLEIYRNSLEALFEVDTKIATSS